MNWGIQTVYKTGLLNSLLPHECHAISIKATKWGFLQPLTSGARMFLGSARPYSEELPEMSSDNGIPFFFSPYGSTAPWGPRPPHCSRFRDYTLDTPDSVGLLWTSDQSVAETSTWQHTTLTRDSHVPGGIGTQNPSKRAAADLRLRPRGHWDRQYPLYQTKISRILVVDYESDILRFLVQPVISVSGLFVP
jgi:hypothetical protein